MQPQFVIPANAGQPAVDTVAQLVSACAARHPHAPALASNSESIDYASLEKRSNQLAHYLRALGIGREQIVAVLLPRSIALVVTELAVLKAGGAYLPVDPASPHERVSTLVADARPAVLVTRRGLAEGLRLGGCKVVTLEHDRLAIAAQSTEPMDPVNRPEDLAYVIYTSGSTGTPKGVEIEHASLLNLITWHQRQFSVHACDRASQVASPAFDAAVWEIWPYLTAGASLHIAPNSARTDPELLRDWMLAQKITIAFAPTPLAERLLALAWPEETALRYLLTGADTLRSYPRPDLPFVLVNNYGPTECTVVATSGTVPSAAAPPGRLPAIGKPIQNVHIHVLDEHRRPVAPGGAGEIYIGGGGVGRGYLNSPELTAARFVRNTVGPLAGTRLYRTGDLGRVLPDGQITFLGRIDDQIKVRGFRIDPHEIAAALCRDPALDNAYVCAHEDAGGERHLVAYVVPKPGHSCEAETLREFVAAQLPDYCIPDTFVRLHSLPVSENGKVNKAELPRPDESNILRADSYVAPETPLQQRVAEMVASLLGLPRVGITDNFFLLGGHSLLGTQLIARLRETFAIDVSLRALFNAPTVADLAGEVERLLVARLETMTEEEAERLLNAMNPNAAGSECAALD